MLKLTKINTQHPEYPFVENLLHLSFPEIERRDDERQRDTTDHNPLFGCYLITDTNDNQTTAIGVITLWQLNGFIYAEHLATSPAVRNKGYGKKIMETLREQFRGMIILEVERPEDEMSVRRIGFYQRCGFSLCTKEYVQPPYRKGGEGLPLLLMYAGAESIDANFEQIRDNIYREVYGVTSL